MPFNGDMSSLKLKGIYTSVMDNYSKFVKKIYLYLAATSVTLNSNKSPLIIIFSGNNKVAAKDPIEARNISNNFLAMTYY